MRQLAWSDVPNVGDPGGLPTPWGLTRFGRVARGPRRELLDDKGWQAALDWGLKSVVDLRILPHLVRATLEAIANATPGVLVHCRAGRDRTGLVRALLLANVGVAPEVIADDYTMSVRAMAGVASHQPIKDRQADWTPQAIDAWVETTHPLVLDFARRANTHLDTLQLALPTRQDLRTLLTTP